MTNLARRYAGFSVENTGGNPAGVMIVNNELSDAEMLSIAKKIGDSETVFAVPKGENRFAIRYFAPEAEVDFCGHATVALGKAIKDDFGNGQYYLESNKGTLALVVDDSGEIYFSSPKTSSRELSRKELDFLIANSSIQQADISQHLTPSMVNAGNNHALIVVNNADALANFEYDYDALQPWMRENKVVTFAVAAGEKNGDIRVRNAFAFGGVYEDPATGAAAAAISGFLRDNGLFTGDNLVFRQGEEMGQACLLKTHFSDQAGSEIRVGGNAYFIGNVVL
ncbi:PhzF family phenazine biosynthesis protein [Alteromonas sp. CYL-A6]|uniref:PhzF family phenazine biosynthesis protein n=1 Tax=Alteromonas nitratireducens TaxID=3390813 RepID=UPI0034C3ACBE